MNGRHNCYCQIYLHSQDDIPKVSDLGFAVEPGKHALVVIEHFEVSKLNECRGKMLTASYNSIMHKLQIMAYNNCSEWCLFLFYNIYSVHRFPKKGATKLMAVTSAILNRFSKFFTAWTSCCAKFYRNRITHFGWANRVSFSFLLTNTSQTDRQTNSFISPAGYKYGPHWTH